MSQRRHHRARQLDRHADRQRQLHAERRPIYQVEANAAGQTDRINRRRHGDDQRRHACRCWRRPGNYARNTTYTILNATGGVSGTYSGVTSNFAFLTPTLTYDANNVFLTLFQPKRLRGGRADAQPVRRRHRARPDQRHAPPATSAPCWMRSAASATRKGPAALNAISGQPYADFGTMNVQSGMHCS